MFTLTPDPITPTLPIPPESGGFVSFEGRVRNHNEGLPVENLEYECYEPMALREGERIVQQALATFNIHGAQCIHRYGHLSIGDIALWVGVVSAHRRESFEACQYIIDAVKALVPIWKKEYYRGKKPVWVACHRCRGENRGRASLL